MPILPWLQQRYWRGKYVVAEIEENSPGAVWNDVAVCGSGYIYSPQPQAKRS